jgi:hypothetical protein
MKPLQAPRRYSRPASSLLESTRQAIALSGVLLVLVPAAHSAQEWVQHFSPGTATTAATDASGNVFVTGISPGPGESDMLTLKYSPSGVLLWTNRFSYSPSGNNAPHGLAIAPDSNVIVAAACTGTDGFYDYVTIKYSNAGVPLWTNTYNGPGNSDDMLMGLVVDSKGNVFVTGSSTAYDNYPYNLPVNSDYATIVYTSAGVPMWTNRYNGFGNSFDYAAAIAVDTNGNAFVTGSVSNLDATYDYVTLKYSLGGMALWTNHYNAGTNSPAPKAIATDNNGNVFVTGTTASTTYFDYVTLKYSGAGLTLWTNSYTGPGNGVDEPEAIAVDSQGSVFVAGYSAGVSIYANFATIKYSNGGVPLWTNRWSGTTNNESVATSLALDGSGNVAVTGFFYAGSTTADDIATVAYSNTGVALSTNEYASVGNFDDQANAVTFDRVGNFFVAGSSATTNGYVFTVIKYSPLNGPFLGIERLSDAIVVTWPPGFVLQAATGLQLQFTNVPAATSPYTNKATAPQLFFRLSSN